MALSGGIHRPPVPLRAVVLLALPTTGGFNILRRKLAFQTMGGGEGARGRNMCGLKLHRPPVFFPAVKY